MHSLNMLNQVKASQALRVPDGWIVMIMLGNRVHLGRGLEHEHSRSVSMPQRNVPVQSVPVLTVHGVRVLGGWQASWKEVGASSRPTRMQPLRYPVRAVQAAALLHRDLQI